MKATRLRPIQEVEKELLENPSCEREEEENQDGYDMHAPLEHEEDGPEAVYR
jgi:hypothetical protein